MSSFRKRVAQVHIQKLLVPIHLPTRDARVNLDQTNCVEKENEFVSTTKTVCLILLLSQIYNFRLGRKHFHGAGNCNSARPGDKPVFCQRVMDCGGKRSATPLFARNTSP